MFGNVQEWVKDDGFWFGKYKYLKGGSWKSKDESNFKFESSVEEDARYWGTHVGFRCVFED
jgi:formylglycine-generating enzyme required for sulfatase activity